MASEPIPFPVRDPNNRVLSVREKLTPQNLESEQSTLGAMLMEVEAVARAQGMLVAGDFYRELHKQIFQAIIDLYQRNEPTDIVTVAEELRKKGKLEDVGGSEYLSALIEACPSSANIDAYIAIVWDKSEKRRLLRLADELSAKCWADEVDSKEIRAGAEQAILNSNRQLKDDECFQVGRITPDVLFRFEEQILNPDKIDGIPTGFYDLDRIVGGLQRQNLILVGARPGMGKSSFAMQIATFIAFQNLPVLIFSLEMPRTQLVRRMICNEGRVDFGRFRRGKPAEGEMERVINTVNSFERLPLHIQDTPGMTAFEMAARARRLEHEVGELGLIVVDYLQLVEDMEKGGSTADKIQAKTKAIRMIARERNCPVILLSQLSRKVEEREDKRPMLSDFRDGGSIEAEANEAIFLFNQGYYDRRRGVPAADEPRPGYRSPNDWDAARENEGDITEVIVAKQRDGETSTARLLWTGPHVRFDNLARSRDDDFTGNDDAPRVVVPAPTYAPDGWQLKRAA